MRVRGFGLVAGVLVLVGAAAASCGSQSTDTSGERTDPPENGLTASLEARTKVASLRERFTLARGPSAAREAVVGAGVATSFELQGDALHPVLPATAKRGVSRPASVELPATASAFARLEDDTSHVAVRFALRDARSVPAAVAEGIAVYPGAVGGADVIHRVHAEGTEDYVVFETRPAREELRYEVDVSQVAGLRLVERTLEFLDPTGIPQLRVAPPYVVDARGERHEAALAVDDCSVDESPVVPWGRPVTAPGAASCTVRVTWSDVGYPALVDPVWSATGSMATARSAHSDAALATGDVLVAGGVNGSNLASTEIYNATAGTWSATGSMSTTRYRFRTVTVSGGRVLAAGGFNITSAEVYNPATGMWAATNSATYARLSGTLTVLQSGKVLAAGGCQSSCSTTVGPAEIWDPATGAWSSGGNMADPVWYHAATLMSSGKVLVTGGTNQTVNRTMVQVYDPATNTWMGVANLINGYRETHTSTLLPSGKVLIAGGVAISSGSLNALQTAELFDPSVLPNGAMQSAGSMAIGHNAHTANLLASGKVLIAGGRLSAFGQDRAETELYDPATNAFTLGPSLGTARSDHTATNITPSKVVVAGGGTAGYLSSAERYGLAAGESGCTNGNQCLSGVCEDNVCCSGACSGTCKTCAAGTGACVTVTNADDNDTCTGNNTCDATGACKLKNGQPSASGSACASGIVADGLCCNATCGGGCDACNLSGREGFCAVLAAGTSGANPACAPYVCDGTNAACPMACANDNVCALGYYCATNGTCQPQKGQGEACNLGLDCKFSGACRECTSGNCVDGVCCNAACGKACDVCSVAAGGQTDGICGTAALGTQTPGCMLPQACNGVSQDCAINCSTDDDCATTYYCANDSTCKPRKVQGAICDSSAGKDCKVAGCHVCQSNSCVDGVCCDTQCGPCGSCKTPIAGTCTPTTKDLPPNPVGTCGAYLCDGLKATCPASCTSNADCINGDYCAAGQCVQKLAQGSPCANNFECQTNACADGVCCDSACTGTCLACAASNKQSGTSNGTCGPAKQGTNPGGQCVVDSTNPCGTIAACAGTSASCALAPASKSCGPTTCSGSSGDVIGKVCDGLGACMDSAGQSCAPYICQGGACASPCAADSQCVAGNYCSAGVCVPKTTGGLGCNAANECTTGFCVDSVCCDSPCNGTCQACAELGSLGICKIITGKPRGILRMQCTANDADCAGTCDGNDGQACTYPDSSKACGIPTCNGAVITSHTCDGVGSCNTTPKTQDCGAYLCDTSGAAPVCKSTCQSDVDCSTGSHCNTTTHECGAGSNTCKDAYTVVDPSGNETSCAPYKCQAGVCASACTTVNDCADGYDCTEGHCEKKATGSGGGSTGTGTGGSGNDTGNGQTHIVENKGCCTVAPGSRSDDRQGVIAIALAVAAATRLRRARSRKEAS